MSDQKMLQIMPAQGWVARFADGEGEFVSPLVGWALVQNGTGTAVVGLVAGDKDVVMCTEDEDFLGYAYVPDVLEETWFDTDDDEGDDDFDDDEDEGGPPSAAPRRSSTRLN